MKPLNPLTLDNAIPFARLQREATEAFKVSQETFASKPPLLATPRAGDGGTSLPSSLPNSRTSTSGLNYGVTPSGSSIVSVIKPFN